MMTRMLILIFILISTFIIIYVSTPMITLKLMRVSLVEADIALNPEIGIVVNFLNEFACGMLKGS
jgi:hypothetical protein